MKCRTCRRPAVVDVRRHNAAFCRDHFLHHCEEQVRRAIYLESLLIAIFGALLGLALGITFGVLFTHTLRSQGLTVISIPWTQDAIFLVVAGLVGVLAALWPAIRAARTKPLEAIADA